MYTEQSKLWWLPSSLLALTAIIFLVMSIYGYQRYVAVWIALAVVFFLAATMNFRRRRVAK